MEDFVEKYRNGKSTDELGIPYAWRTKEEMKLLFPDIPANSLPTIDEVLEELEVEKSKRNRIKRIWREMREDMKRKYTFRELACKLKQE